MTAKAMMQAFEAAHAQGDLPAAVELARTKVKSLLLGSGFSDDVMGLAEELAGEWTKDRGAHLVPWDDVTRHVFAAVAMGIAVGQLVHPDVFRGGAQ